MKIKTELLQNYLDEHELTAAILARNMGVNTAEVEKLLSGIAVNEETARRFIYYFGADNAAEYIDWAAIGVGFWLYSKFLAILTDLLRTGEIRNAFDLVTINSIHEVCEKLYPGKFFADILITKNVGMNVGILLGISVFGLAASLLLIKVIYDRVIQKRLEGTRKYKFKEHKFKARSVVGTLLYKEFVTVLRTPSYAFQYFATAVTLPFMVYVCVNLLRSLMSTLTFYNCDFELAMFVISTFGILTNTFCASNVSRDGGMYAMIKTMPIRCKDYMTAKLVFCGIVSVISSLACSVTLLIAEFLSPWQAVFAFLMGVILSVAEIAFATRKDMKNPTFPKRGERRFGGSIV